MTTTIGSEDLKVTLLATFKALDKIEAFVKANLQDLATYFSVTADDQSYILFDQTGAHLFVNQQDKTVDRISIAKDDLVDWIVTTLINKQTEKANEQEQEHEAGCGCGSEHQT